MARMHSRKHGKSHSIRPPSGRAPNWVNYSPDEIVMVVTKMAKDGLTSSEIGVRLRDQYGIPLIKSFLGRSMLQVMKESRVEPSPREDLARLLARAKSLQVHLDNNHGDRKNVRSLELLEAKIHRLSKYYKRKGLLPADWKYSAVVAQLA